MRHIIFVLLSIVALSAAPRKTLTLHSIPKANSEYSVIMSGVGHTDTIKKKEYSMFIEYDDSVPKTWSIYRPSRAVQFDSDPRLMPVYFNHASPKFFHAYPDCKKLGAFRKLSETPIEDFLRSNKTANICPDCMQRHKSFFFVTQFILDD